MILAKSELCPGWNKLQIPVTPGDEHTITTGDCISDSVPFANYRSKVSAMSSTTRCVMPEVVIIIIIIIIIIMIIVIRIVIIIIIIIPFVPQLGIRSSRHRYPFSSLVSCTQNHHCTVNAVHRYLSLVALSFLLQCPCDPLTYVFGYRSLFFSFL